MRGVVSVMALCWFGTQTLHAEPPAGAELPPLATVRLGTVTGALIAAQDGEWVYVLNLSDRVVQRVAIAELRLDATSLPAPEGTVGMAPSPDRSRLYLYAEGQSHSESSLAVPGRLAVVDTAAWRVGEEVPLPPMAGVPYPIQFAPRDLAADDRGRVYFSTESGAIHRFDLGARKLEGPIGGPSGLNDPVLRLHPKGNRLYLGSRGVSPASLGVGTIPANLKAKVQWRRTDHGVGPAGGEFILAPSGKYLIQFQGSVWTLSEESKKDLAPSALVDAHFAVALDEEAGLLFLAAERQMLAVFTFPGCTCLGRWRLASPVYGMALSTTKRRLVCAVSPVVKRYEPIPSNFDHRQGRGAGDLHVYDVSAFYAK